MQNKLIRDQGKCFYTCSDLMRCHYKRMYDVAFWLSACVYSQICYTNTSKKAGGGLIDVVGSFLLWAATLSVWMAERRETLTNLIIGRCCLDYLGEIWISLKVTVYCSLNLQWLIRLFHSSYARESNKLIDLPDDYSCLINQASNFS